MARRTAITAAALVVALLAPLVLLTLQRHSQPPVIGPSKPPIVHTPQTTAEPRKLSMPGVSLDSMPLTNYLDSRRAWTWHSTCWVPAPPPGCGTVAVRTNDGGLTWQQVTMPPIDARSGQCLATTTRIGPSRRNRRYRGRVPMYYTDLTAGSG